MLMSSCIKARQVSFNSRKMLKCLSQKLMRNDLFLDLGSFLFNTYFNVQDLLKYCVRKIHLFTVRCEKYQVHDLYVPTVR